MQRLILAATFAFFAASSPAFAADSAEPCAAQKAKLEKCKEGGKRCDKAEIALKRCEGSQTRACKKLPDKIARCERKLAGRKTKLEACEAKGGKCEKQRTRFEKQQETCKGLQELKGRCDKSAPAPTPPAKAPAKGA